MADAPLQIGLLLFPRLTQLDMTGPFEVFARLPNTKVHLVWKSREPVTSDVGLQILPTTTLAECPDLDVVCVPGGPGMNALLEDEEVLAFLRRQGAQARYVTSVCTGALVLGAAGLLKGYKAATHWASMDVLPLLGAEPVHERVVVDRNRITGGGVTAGLDFGLVVVAKLYGERMAQLIQLGEEYDPAPPFNAGSPRSAPPDVVTQLRGLMAKSVDERMAIAKRVAATFS